MTSLAHLLNREPWMNTAACHEDDPEKWFPTSDKADVERAKTICRACPVAESCLTYALENSEQFGVWGGLTEDERESLKRRKRRATNTEIPHGTQKRYANYACRCDSCRAAHAQHSREQYAKKKREALA